MPAMTPRDEVVLEYSMLDDGTTSTGNVCPSCDGGANGDKSLAVTSTNGTLLWICYRASCGFKGVHSIGASAFGKRQKHETKKSKALLGKMYALRSHALPDEIKEYLASKYNLYNEDFSRAHLGWEENQKRLVLPLLDVNGGCTGAALRSLSGAKPKALTYAEPSQMAWYKNPTSTSLVIVEDQLSAIKASRYINAVALLGVNLNSDRARTIASEGFDNVYLALDKDALAISIKSAASLRSTLRVEVLSLQKDIKDMQDNDIKTLLRV
jgi:hypothetical protein